MVIASNQAGFCQARSEIKTVMAINMKLSEFDIPIEYGLCPLKFSLQNYIKLPDQPTPQGICLRLLSDPNSSLIGRWIERLDQNTD